MLAADLELLPCAWEALSCLSGCNTNVVGYAWALTGAQVTAEARRQQRALWHQSPSTDIFPRPVPQHTRRYPGCQAEGNTRAAVMWPNSRHLSYIGACSEFQFCPSLLNCIRLSDHLCVHFCCAGGVPIAACPRLDKHRHRTGAQLQLPPSCACRGALLRSLQ